MATVQQVFEEVLDDILSSWTALELAMNHYDGHFREGQDKRMVLLGSLSDAIRSEQYELEDVAEFLFKFLDEEFNMELDDNSDVDVAAVSTHAWQLVRQGIRPQLVRRVAGASVSVIQDHTQEVEGEPADADMEDDAGGKSQFANQPRIVTDDDGWSTIVPRERR